MAAIPHPGAAFAIGSLAVEGPDAVAVWTRDRTEFLALPPEMSGTWRWKIGLWRGLIVEGARAAARFSLGRVLGPPEQGWATKVMDFIRVEHELLAEVVEYVDRRPRRG